MSGSMVEILPFTLDRLEDVLEFEMQLRREEPDWGWEIDDAYQRAVKESFSDPRFAGALTLLAYKDGRVVGRIDAALAASHFEGAIQAYLDWICVLKSCRHQGIAQALMAELRARLKAQGLGTLVGLIAANPEAQSFYRSMEGAKIRDEGIWIDL